MSYQNLLHEEDLWKLTILWLHFLRQLFLPSFQTSMQVTEVLQLRLLGHGLFDLRMVVEGS